MKRETLLAKNWKRGLCTKSILNTGFVRGPEENKLPFGIRYAEVQETVEDIDIMEGYIVTLAVSSEEVIYRDASPYTRLYSFRSEIWPPQEIDDCICRKERAILRVDWGDD